LESAAVLSVHGEGSERGEVYSPPDCTSVAPGEELNVEDDADEDREEGLSQREDSGIINSADHRTSRGFSADQTVMSSSSSDSEGEGEGGVTVLRQADVVVHALADSTGAGEGASGPQDISATTRRRASDDSVDR